MNFDIDTYYKDLTEAKDVLLAYKGSITSDFINKTLEEVERKLLDSKEIVKTRKKVYNVLVESLQNLYHHVDDLPEQIKNIIEPKFGVVVIALDDIGFKINTGNFISSNKIKYLKDKIDKINSLSKEELKDMYKFILNHQKLSAKGGGGLGLVDIARKTNNKISYSFYPVSENYFFFNFEIYINN
jgi:hypothetical protein